MLHKIRSFLQLDNQMKYLLLEAYILLAWARYRKSKEFSKVSLDLGRRMNETSFQINESEMKIVKRVSRVIHLASRYTFWESECLVKAMASMKMLERRGIESTLYLGVAREHKGLIAHAWLRCGNFYVSGSSGMERFTVVEKFAKFI